MTVSDDGVILEVFVQPRAARNSIVGEYQGALKIKTTAPPVEGQANQAVQEQIASWLGVSKGAVSVISGHSSRLKRVLIEGLSPAELASALDLVLSSRPHEPG